MRVHGAAAHRQPPGHGLRRRARDQQELSRAAERPRVAGLADPGAAPRGVAARARGRRSRRRVGERHAAARDPDPAGAGREGLARARSRSPAAPAALTVAAPMLAGYAAGRRRGGARRRPPRRARRRSPAWCELPVGRVGRALGASPWPGRGARTVAAGRSAILVVPDYRDQDSSRPLSRPCCPPSASCGSDAAAAEPRPLPGAAAGARRGAARRSSATARPSTPRPRASGSSRSGTTATRCSASRSARTCTRAMPRSIRQEQQGGALVFAGHTRTHRGRAPRRGRLARASSRPERPRRPRVVADRATPRRTTGSPRRPASRRLAWRDGDGGRRATGRCSCRSRGPATRRDCAAPTAASAARCRRCGGPLCSSGARRRADLLQLVRRRRRPRGAARTASGTKLRPVGRGRASHRRGARPRVPGRPGDRRRRRAAAARGRRSARPSSSRPAAPSRSPPAATARCCCSTASGWSRARACGSARTACAGGRMPPRSPPTARRSCWSGSGARSRPRSRTWRQAELRPGRARRPPRPAASRPRCASRPCRGLRMPWPRRSRAPAGGGRGARDDAQAEGRARAIMRFDYAHGAEVAGAVRAEIIRQADDAAASRCPGRRDAARPAAAAAGALRRSGAVRGG